MKTTTPIVSAVLVAAFAAPALAQPSIAVTLSETEFFTDPSEGEFGILLSDPTPDPFTADFGLLGDTQVSVTWQAPAGQFFEIAPPVGFDFPSLIFRVQTDGGFSSSGSFDSFDLSLDIAGQSGDALPTPNNTFLEGSGPGSLNLIAGVDIDLVAGEVYRFTSLTLTGTLPAGYNQNFNGVGLNARLIARTNDLTGTLPDPGAWVHVVPMPGTAAMLGLGGLLAARRRR